MQFFSLTLFLIFFFQAEMSNDNPWEVSDASVFLKYCCPECDYQCSQLDSFGIHATKNHDLSSILFEETKGG